MVVRRLPLARGRGVLGGGLEESRALVDLAEAKKRPRLASVVLLIDAEFHHEPLRRLLVFLGIGCVRELLQAPDGVALSVDDVIPSLLFPCALASSDDPTLAAILGALGLHEAEEVPVLALALSPRRAWQVAGDEGSRICGVYVCLVEELLGGVREGLTGDSWAEVEGDELAIARAEGKAGRGLRRRRRRDGRRRGG